MVARAKLEYTKRVRVGYQPSNDALRITFPDAIRFPSTTAYVKFRDYSTVVVSPNASKGADHLQFALHGTTPGCRELNWNGVHGIGRHFRITPVDYVVEGNDIVITLPDEEQRQLPVRRGNLARAHTAPSAPLPKKPEVASDPWANLGNSLRNTDGVDGGPAAGHEIAGYDFSNGRWLRTVLSRSGGSAVCLEPIDGELVRIIGFGNDFLYHVPMDVMLQLIDKLAPFRRG